MGIVFEATFTVFMWFSITICKCLTYRDSDGLHPVTWNRLLRSGAELLTGKGVSYLSVRKHIFSKKRLRFLLKTAILTS